MGSRGLLDLLICRIPGTVSADRVALARRFGDETSFLERSVEDIDDLLGRSRGKYTWSMEDLLARAEGDAAAMKVRGMELVSIMEDAYPAGLREICDPPAALFYRGTLPPWERPMAAVIGTRRPGPGALAQTYEIARDLGRRGIPVVSGLAMGIDAMAHRGAMAGGGLTLAVLGSGLDEVYPALNRNLARMILESEGCLLSEYPPGTLPRKQYFPARNRIISGLARGVLVAEAPSRSGALITARFAREQGRDLWVASAGVFSPQGEGTGKLSAGGARIIGSASDILSEWYSETSWEAMPEEDDPIVSLAKTLRIDL
jgi:DNA processing protein